MALTYKSFSEERADKNILETLQEALDAAKNSLKRDECGAWRLTGTKGHIYSWGPAGEWLIYVACPSPWKWRNTKKRFKTFATVTQDGDDEGCFRLPKLPTPKEATIIRNATGIRQSKPRPVNAFPTLK